MTVPYTPAEMSKESNEITSKQNTGSKETVISHDTIGMVAIDVNGNLASGTSTNGANHKIPGRLGDSAIPGSGSYVDQDIGAAAATGDGDVLMRFLPSYSAVEYMGLGMTPVTAAEYSLRKIVKYYPDFNGAVVVLNATENSVPPATDLARLLIQRLIRTWGIHKSLRLPVRKANPE